MLGDLPDGVTVSPLELLANIESRINVIIWLIMVIGLACSEFLRDEDTKFASVLVTR